MARNKFLTLLSFFVLLLGAPNVTSLQQLSDKPEKSVLSGGTLIVGIPTKDGIVACADKRLHDNRGGNSDSEVKIHRLEDKWIWMAAGTYYISSNDSLTTLALPQTSWAFGGFSLAGSIGSWRLNESLLTMRPTITLLEAPGIPNIAYPPRRFSDSWDELTRKIKNDLTNYGMRKVNPVTPNPDNLILQVLFLKIEEDGSTSAHLVEAKSSLGDVFVGHGPLIKPDLNKASPLTLGSSEVYFELKEGKKSEFNELRENFYIKPFLGDDRPKEQVTANEALAFAITLIKVTSERGKELNELIEVSPNCYCGLLNSKDGFKWISQDEYPAPVPPKPVVTKHKKSKTLHRKVPL